MINSLIGGRLYTTFERWRVLTEKEATELLIRIDERVKHIDEKLDAHIHEHDKNSGRTMEWLGILSAVALGVWSNIKNG